MIMRPPKPTMTRQDMIKVVNGSPVKEFRNEVDHYMTIDDREYPYDEVFALFDIEERQEGVAKAYGERRLLTEARRLLIAIGFYRIMPPEEIASTWVSSGTKWYFRMKGNAYTSDYNTGQWESPDSQYAYSPATVID